MSTVSLEEFLKPISQALGRTEPPASIEPCEATKAPLPGDYRDYSTEELAQWFTEEATKMGTIVREAKPEEVSQVVLDLLTRSVKADTSFIPTFPRSMALAFPKF